MASRKTGGLPFKMEIKQEGLLNFSVKIYPPEFNAYAGFLSKSWRAMIIRCNSFVPSPTTSNGASR